MSSKTCLKCEQEFPVTSFTKDSTRPDGYYPYCRNCKNAIRKTYQYDQEKARAAKRRYNNKRRAAMRADGSIVEEWEYGKARHRTKQATDPEYREQARQRASEYYHSMTLAERRAKKEEYRRNDPDFARKKQNRHLRKLYGITVDEYESLHQQQGGCCSICGRHESQFKKRLFVDHCHTSGKVRELLCGACNFLVGTLETSPDVAAKAIDYINKHT